MTVAPTRIAIVHKSKSGHVLEQLHSRTRLSRIQRPVPVGWPLAADLLSVLPRLSEFCGSGIFNAVLP
jgi:hypothetical protein